MKTDLVVEVGCVPIARASDNRAGSAPGALRSRLLRHSSWDLVLIALALLHGGLLLAVPSVPLVALGLWWNANTISHNFVHLPFFRPRAANALFSAYLSLLLGLPQSLWAARHLAHHRDEPFHWTPLRSAWLVESALVLALWSCLLVLAPRFFVTVYLPGWLLGLGLCQLQGHFEHAHGTVSHYGWLYNRLFFNDGYHVEHHAQPTRHWRALAEMREATAANVSRWPATLRWLECLSLDGLEELVCRSVMLQRWVLTVHQRAMKHALAHMPPPNRILIVGGGLFPRTALILRKLVPDAVITIVDMRGDRLEQARRWLDGNVELVCAFCTTRNLSMLAEGADLVVVPLALRGGRVEFYREPPAPHVLVHDWLWRSRGWSIIVSPALLKRLNLVTP